jgi:hypothetical protein
MKFAAELSNCAPPDARDWSLCGQRRLDGNLTTSFSGLDWFMYSLVSDNGFPKLGAGRRHTTAATGTCTAIPQIIYTNSSGSVIKCPRQTIRRKVHRGAMASLSAQRVSSSAFS